MIIIKTERELELMRTAGRIVALAHQSVKQHVKPGITLKQLDKIVEDVIIDQGAIPSFKGYGGFPASSCISVNDTIVHGIPNDTVLKDGDIVSIDIGACYKGYHGDSAWTYPVGTISCEAQKLLEVSEQALYAGLEMAIAGNRLSDISNAIENSVKEYNYGIPRQYTGHGIGKSLHEDPIVPNYGLAGQGPVLKPGMTIAVEPMINIGTDKSYVLSDDWTVKTKDQSLSAHFEHTIAIHEDGYEILTKL